jgi:hypothetical protein
MSAAINNLIRKTEELLDIAENLDAIATSHGQGYTFWDRLKWEVQMAIADVEKEAKDA